MNSYCPSTMKRRKFIQSTTLAGIAPLTSMAGDHTMQTPQKELIEIRVYEMTFARDAQLLINYLTGPFRDFLSSSNCSIQLYKELGDSEPRKTYGIITYSDAGSYIEVQELAAEHVLSETNKGFHWHGKEASPYNRFESWLLHAFDKLPQFQEPIQEATVFELRTYEAYSLNALQRKIKMFNNEEIDLFNKLDLRPIFFGEMIAGPYRPCLTYMLNFKNMEERNANWDAFIKHPEWRAMAGKEEYANTVSNIRKTFLKPI